MNFNFYKYQGTGNDFIMIDGRNLKATFSTDQIKKLCDRRFGIGADGLIILKPHSEYDFEMDYYNADGSQSFCGNGSRCAQAFAKQIGLIENKSHFLAIDGPHLGEQRGALFATKMGDVDSIEQRGEDFLIDTGSPHYVRFENNLLAIDVFKLGRTIRNSKEFVKNGVNVNFVSKQNKGIKVKTYERGVEAETLSCGTGVTAAALAYAEKYDTKSSAVDVETMGGELKIEFSRQNDGTFKEIWLIGPAVLVFSGEIAL